MMMFSEIFTCLEKYCHFYRFIVSMRVTISFSLWILTNKHRS